MQRMNVTIFGILLAMLLIGSCTASKKDATKTDKEQISLHKAVKEDQPEETKADNEQITLHKAAKEACCSKRLASMVLRLYYP